MSLHYYNRMDRLPVTVLHQRGKTDMIQSLYNAGAVLDTPDNVS